MPTPTGASGVSVALPEILEELGKLRKKAKKAMALAEADAQFAEEAAAMDGDSKKAAEQKAAEQGGGGKELAALYEKEQLAYKVVMNSVYGFTAADTLRLLALAETITFLRRTSLSDNEIAEALCADMELPESRVVYGDTDSIFVHVAGAAAEEALDVGACIAKACNDHFKRKTKSPVLQLEFEALFDGILLVGKKTYAGLQHAVLVLPQGCTLWGVGERVPYYYAETDELLACDRAEDPVYGDANDVPPDRVHYFDLTKKSLDQALSVVAEVAELVYELDTQHIAPLREMLKKRRKLAAEMQEQARQGQQSITGFLTGNVAEAARVAAPPPKRKRPEASASITGFLTEATKRTSTPKAGSAPPAKRPQGKASITSFLE